MASRQTRWKCGHALASRSRRQVHAAAEPPPRPHGPPAGLQTCARWRAPWARRVVRVQDQRHAHGLKRRDQLGPVLGGRGRQHASFDVREVDTAALEDQAPDQARGPVASSRPPGSARPTVGQEGIAIDLPSWLTMRCCRPSSRRSRTSVASVDAERLDRRGLFGVAALPALQVAAEGGEVGLDVARELQKCSTRSRGS